MASNVLSLSDMTTRPENTVWTTSAMSYDVHLQRFREQEPQLVRSPQVWALLERAWEAPPDDLGYSRVTWHGDEADLYTEQPGDPIDGLMFSRAGRRVYDLIYRLAVAGDFVIIPPDCGPFLVDERQQSHLPQELTADAVVVGSGEELARLIESA